MKIPFENYHKIPEGKYSNIWDNALFILDTNILLNFFRYPEKARADFIKILNEIKSNLWVPFVAGLEFYENLEYVKNGQIRAYDKVYSLIGKTKSKELGLKDELISELKKLNLDKRHFDISEEKLIEDFELISKEYQDKISLVQEKYLFDDTSSQKEKIKEENLNLLNDIETLLKNKIGKPFESQSEIDKINKEGKTRFESLIPPGFKDSSKERDSKKRVLTYNSLIYKREFCDLYIWKEIISKSISIDNKNIIFITDDVKDDWWRIVNGKTVGPRIELIDEIKSKTDGKVATFLMYNSWRFLEYATEKYNIKLKSETLHQIKEVQENKTVSRIEILKIYKAYKNYVDEIYPEYEFVSDRKKNLMIYMDDALDLVAFDVRVVKFPEKFDIKKVVKNIEERFHSGGMNEYFSYTLVIIEFNKKTHKRNQNIYFDYSKKLPKGIDVISYFMEIDEMKNEWKIVE